MSKGDEVVAPLDQLEFKHPWRDYQARILDELADHLSDQKLHVVAAPGSGKTVLGIEVLRRIRRRTLILAPTLAIRDQWIDRIVSLFLPDGAEEPDWISRSVRAPGFVTVSTYQGLYVALKGGTGHESDAPSPETVRSKSEIRAIEGSKVLDTLREVGLHTLVVDEAHHLRKEWWKALTELDKALVDTQVVALTATPPYDVDANEWARYEALCGPVDCEVAIPELVGNGDLCPHQDYIHFSTLTASEHEKLEQFRSDIEHVRERVLGSQALKDAISSYDWIVEPQEHIDDILAAPQIFSAYLVYLNACGSRPRRSALNILGVSGKVPEFDDRWLEHFLQAVLFAHRAPLAHVDDVVLKDCHRELKRCGAIFRRKVQILDTDLVKRTLSGSLGKIQSVVDIARAEVQTCGDDLRMVVLADYIRSEELPKSQDDVAPVSRMGVVPIFETLRRANIPGMRLGVLTGSLVLLPASAQNRVRQISGTCGIASDAITFEVLPHDSGFCRLKLTGKFAKSTVKLVTELLRIGEINALIGTQSLLGEGWDSPCLNTLVLASQVGSFMLSNQMRGRAIRTDPDRADKVANIWHLASADPPGVFLDAMRRQNAELLLDPFDEIRKDLGWDIQRLRQRFRTFVGPSFTALRIESGLRRMDLDGLDWSPAAIARRNSLMIDHARQRDAVRSRWSATLEHGSVAGAAGELLEVKEAPNRFVVSDTLTMFVSTTVAMALMIWYGVSNLAGAEGNPLVQVVALAIAFGFTAHRFVKALSLYLRTGSIEGALEEVGNLLLEALASAGVLQNSINQIDFRAQKNSEGLVSCRIDGANNADRIAIFSAMEEILNPIENPRYVIERRTWLGPFNRVDYHAVPKELAKRKEFAELFCELWNRRIAPGRLVFTRTPDGRRTLIRARASAFSNQMQKNSQRFKAWE